MFKLNFGGYMSPTHQIWIADSGRKGVQNCTKWVQNYDPVFYLETAFRRATCLQPSKLELRITEEGRVYKIWDFMYKIVLNEYKIMIQFLCWNRILQPTKFELPIAEGCTKFGTRCTKLYKMSTKLWSSFLSWNCISEGYMSPTIQIGIADNGRKKGVQYLGLDIQKCTKLVQNLWSSFLSWNCIWGLHVTSPQIWNAGSARRKGIQNLGLDVQNCTK